MLRKLTFKYVKNFIENEGYKLLSTEYINSKEKLKIRCDKNHIYDARFNSFYNGDRCPTCFGTPKHTYSYVKNYVEDKGYILISEKYINNHEKLEMICPNNHLCNIRFDNFKNGNRCSICNGNKKYSYEYIKEYFGKEKYQLLSTEYKNSNSLLMVKCTSDHIYKTSFSNFRKGYRCSKCKQSGPEKEVVKFIKENYTNDIIENDRLQLVNPLTNHWLELDIFFPKLNKAIEVNGYWHCLKDHVKRDKIKKKQCQNKNIDLMIIQSKDWKKKKDSTQKKILSFLNI